MKHSYISGKGIFQVVDTFVINYPKQLIWGDVVGFSWLYFLKVLEKAGKDTFMMDCSSHFENEEGMEGLMDGFFVLIDFYFITR